jgi:hypothetical protein
MATPTITPFTMVRTGFYRKVDLFYLIENLKHNFKFLNINIEKITRGKDIDGNDEVESVIDGEVRNHKLFIVVNSITSLFSFHIETYNNTNDTWVQGGAKENLTVGAFNLMFPDILEAIK